MAPSADDIGWNTLNVATRVRGGDIVTASGIVPTRGVGRSSVCDDGVDGNVRSVYGSRGLRGSNSVELPGRANVSTHGPSRPQWGCRS